MEPDLHFELLGLRMKDSVSGLTGIVCSITRRFSGTIQYGLQPEGDGKTFPDSWNLDFDILDKVDEGVRSRIKSEFPTTSAFSIGSEVEDTLSGFKGKVQDITYHLNGCVTCSVTGKSMSPDKDVFTLYADQSRFKLLAPAVTEPAAPTKRGGPSVRAMRY